MVTPGHVPPSLSFPTATGLSHVQWDPSCQPWTPAHTGRSESHAGDDASPALGGGVLVAGQLQTEAKAEAPTSELVSWGAASVS